MCACTNYLFACLFVCVFYHFVWCGGASLAAVDSEPEWLWQVGSLPLYTGTVAAQAGKGRTGHTLEKGHPGQVVLSCSSPLFPPHLLHHPTSCWLSKIWSFSLGSVKADMAFSELERQRRRAWEARGRILAPCLDHSPRVQVGPVRKNSASRCKGVWVRTVSLRYFPGHHVIRGHRWPKIRGCWWQAAAKCRLGHFPRVTHACDSLVGILYTS